MYLLDPRPYALSFAQPVKGMGGCTAKTIHNHKRCCRAADEFEPQLLDCNIRDDPRVKKNGPSAWGLGRCTSWDRFYGHAKGKRCPLDSMCVRATLAPRCSRFTISQICEMIGSPAAGGPPLAFPANERFDLMGKPEHER